jgi:uncharacterized protein (DUF2147 family)
MSRSKLLFAIVFFVSLGQAWADGGNDPTGIWLTQAGDAKIRISRCSTTLCGTIVWLKAPVNPATGKPQIDDKNANPALTKRPIIGINIFKAMKAVANNKWSGVIYNADDGKSYSSDVIVAGARKLEVRGCVMGILCGGEIWTKVGDVTVADAADQLEPSSSRP